MRKVHFRDEYEKWDERRPGEGGIRKEGRYHAAQQDEAGKYDKREDAHCSSEPE